MCSPGKLFRITELLSVCGRFNKLSIRWFREYPWPEAEKIEEYADKDEAFLFLYKELHYRHIYAMHKVNLCIVLMYSDA